jgi:radical SAM-linked protein
MVEKLRIRFRKAGDLRFLSHHDLMRLFERMLRRAGLPFRSTQGFHPKPKMQFASALALGIVGHEEVLEVEFDDAVPADDVQQRLVAQSLPGLQILSVCSIPTKLKGQGRRATYFVPLDSTAHPQLTQRINEFLAAPACWLERTRPHAKRIDIRPYVEQLELRDAGLTMTLQITPNGAARAEEVLQALGLSDLLQNGLVLERTRLELADEQVMSVVRCPSAVASGQTTNHGQRTMDSSKGTP